MCVILCEIVHFSFLSVHIRFTPVTLNIIMVLFSLHRSGGGGRHPGYLERTERERDRQTERKRETERRETRKVGDEAWK